MKTTKSHGSATEASEKVIRILEKSDLVSKIGLGIIKQTKGKSGNISIKFLPITGGIKSAVIGGGTVQDIYIYTKEADEVKKLLAFLR